MATWDPAQYERYKAYRDRPAQDLLARIPADLEPREIWDLGCGTGEHAAQLKRRYPDAAVHGLDSSAEMLARAQTLPDAVDWVEADLAGWRPERAPDLIFSNAALQWLPGHMVLFPRLVQSLAPGGVFACQMPVSWSAPWHGLLRETAADGAWAGKFQGLEGVRPLADADDYYGWLAPLCASVDIWTTTYLHVLGGDDPVVDWMLGTGLRPYLERLSGDPERRAFLDAYRARLAPAFPRRPEGTTLLPFPRLFLVSRRA